VRSKDTGSTLGPEDGVPSSDGVVGFGRIWPCISRDVVRARARVKPARQERWKEGPGAGLDTVTGTGAAAVAAAGT